MKDANGKWIGLGAGDADPEVARFKVFIKRKFAWVRDFTPPLDDSDVYDSVLVEVVSELQRRYGLSVTGVLDYALKIKCGFVVARPPVKPIAFSVEGHLSNMFAGPVADSAAQLEREDVCKHQPIGYNNGALPFDNDSGVRELARLVGSNTMDNGTPFPAGTPFMLFGYSQGMIVVTDFIVNWLAPGKALNWRLKDCRGVLAYGNPCRSTGSVAPWSIGQAGPSVNAGMDPVTRLDLLGLSDLVTVMDVYRKGDIFADNEPTVEGRIKSAIYLAIARGDIFSNPYSICAQIAAAFQVTIEYVFGAFQAIVSGIGFLADNPNPHYASFDLGGGIDWARRQLAR